VTIKAQDYAQGEHYARMTDAPFFVTHNSRETKYWRVKKDRMPGYIEEIPCTTSRTGSTCPKRPCGRP